MRFHDGPGMYVAHYTRAEIALDLILRNNRLRLGSLSATNDPRETKTWSFGLAWSFEAVKSRSEPERRAWHDRHIDFNRILRYGCKVLCVSQDAEKAWTPDSSQRSYSKPRMWAQYGGNHSGVCLIFDKESINEAIEVFRGHQIVASGPVDYTNYKVGTVGFSEYMDACRLSGDDLETLGLEGVLHRHRDEHMHALFFRKDKDWEAESEYRWIICGETNEPEFIPIEHALRAILIGVDFPQSRLREVHEYCKQMDTPLSRIIWINGVPYVQWVEPDQFSAPEYRSVMEFFRLIPPS